MKKLEDLLITFIYEVVSLFIIILPDPARQKAGVLLGKLLFKAVKSYSEIAYRNMRLVLKDDMTSAEIDQLVESNFVHMGRVIVEFIMLRKLNRNNFREYIDLSIEGEEYLKEAHAKGKGVIIYAAHLGNWEWLGAILSFLGYPVTAIAQRQHNESFDRSINKIRRATGVKLIFTRKITQRDAYVALKKNECLYVLGEQYPLSNGWPVNFFGQPTYAFSGVVRFAQRTGATIVPTFLVREGWRKHRLVFLAPYEIPKDNDQTRQQGILQELTDQVEMMIRKYPDQWLWIHERWR
ncbi:MAG TPA: hypothetical protein DD789_02600 [Firmicutes bacterium]|jgi:KDO2-lipid IV(A) lauroyltransferase|nr:hypothetical protein [Bacillota bacterium]